METFRRRGGEEGALSQGRSLREPPPPRLRPRPWMGRRHGACAPRRHNEPRPMRARRSWWRSDLTLNPGRLRRISGVCVLGPDYPRIRRLLLRVMERLSSAPNWKRSSAKYARFDSYLTGFRFIFVREVCFVKVCLNRMMCNEIKSFICYVYGNDPFFYKWSKWNRIFLLTDPYMNKL